MVDQVHAVLREQILTGALPRGSRLPQETIAAELGVSRTPLREALRRLAGEGLVTLQPNHGATVSGVDFNDMNAAWVARLAIEPFAARLAAERRDAGELERMAAAIAEQRAALHPADALDSNREFHLALVAASGNDHLDPLCRAAVGHRVSASRSTPLRPASRTASKRGPASTSTSSRRSPAATPTWQSSSPAPICSATHRWSTRTRRDAESGRPSSQIAVSGGAGVKSRFSSSGATPWCSAACWAAFLTLSGRTSFTTANHTSAITTTASAQ